MTGEGRTIYATIGKKCGQTHYYEFKLTGIGMMLKEVNIRNAGDVQRLYVDEAVRYHNIGEVLANNNPSRKLAKGKE